MQIDLECILAVYAWKCCLWNRCCLMVWMKAMRNAILSSSAAAYIYGYACDPFLTAFEAAQKRESVVRFWCCRAASHSQEPIAKNSLRYLTTETLGRET
jgi:hypothetical protein